MRYVRIDRERDGNTLDPTGYLDAIAEFAGQLPVGARAYATDPQHYDFYSQRCVKDLKPLTLTFGFGDATGWIELRLGHNCWKHEEDLTIRYTGVRNITADPDAAATNVTALGDVILDELLPDEAGCRHEIACLGGSLVVVAADLLAVWSEADCPERPARPS
jgi:hypothetical protein